MAVKEDGEALPFADRVGVGVRLPRGRQEDAFLQRQGRGRKSGIHYGSSKTKPVASFSPNSLGLYDMNGNPVLSSVSLLGFRLARDNCPFSLFSVFPFSGKLPVVESAVPYTLDSATTATSGFSCSSPAPCLRSPIEVRCPPVAESGFGPWCDAEDREGGNHGHNRETKQHKDSPECLLVPSQCDNDGSAQHAKTHL